MTLLFFQKNPKIFRFWISFLMFAFFVLSTPFSAKAASLTAVSNVMTRVKAATLSSHDISFTLGGSTTLDASETVIIDFGEDDTKFVVGGAATVVGDLDFNDGTERTILNVGGACSDGANNMIASINDTTGVLTFIACNGFTSSGAGATINVEYGTSAGGTNRVTNPSTSTPVVNITAAGDTGSFAAAIITDDQVVVSTTIDPYLTFALTTNTVTLTNSSGGNPNYTASGEGYNMGAANTLAAATNASSGYTISYNGTTLTSGGNTIDAIGGTPAVNNEGTEQFGINLKDNTDPNTGADPSGGTGAPVADYNTADSFAYEADSTTSLASASGATAATTYAVSYLVNVSATTQAGAYQTTITYIATGNF